MGVPTRMKPEWRSRQTRRTQNALPFGRVGSNPTSGILLFSSALRPGERRLRDNSPYYIQPQRNAAEFL